MLEKLIADIKNIIVKSFDKEMSPDCVNVVSTNKDFKGDLSLILFPIAKYIRKSPADIAQHLTAILKNNFVEIQEVNFVNGYLNIELNSRFLLSVFQSIATDEENYFKLENNDKKVLIEFSSPNTNKPLHLGHIRNNVLGDSMSKIFASLGYEVIKTNLVNDRGIHICKSMLAWQKFANNQTPKQANIKGDHFVGKYYVLFESESKKEEPDRRGVLINEAREMLRKWEQKDPETIELWKTMNAWVYKGFDETYRRLNISFDKTYYESDTYLLGKKIILEGLNEKIFYQKSDGSIWVDLTNEGLDEKVLLRSDGTSVYLTQDIGTAELKYEDYKPDQSIYVVGSEQDYHFKVLIITLKKLGKLYADSLYHLSYGMVDLPSGKMKSREGTVVDADDIINKMYDIAKDYSSNQDKLASLTEQEKTELYNQIGIGALKYYLLKVEAKKRIVFNPNEAIDIQGNTGPFIQYTHARINSLLEKSKISTFDYNVNFEITQTERNLIILLNRYIDTLKQAAVEYNPSILANYIFELAKTFNKFYHEEQILNNAKELGNKQIFKLHISKLTKIAIKEGLGNLGIEAPNQM